MVQACADNVKPTAKPTIVYLSIFTYYSWNESLEYNKVKEGANILFDVQNIPKLYSRKKGQKAIGGRGGEISMTLFVISVPLYASPLISDKFGHQNCVILRDSCEGSILTERS
jgi:hypothetical protein